VYVSRKIRNDCLLIFFHRPGGDSPVNTVVAMTQLRSTRRKSQTNEENTYSEVFSIAPVCPVQSCPAYKSSVDLSHDYDFVDDLSNIANRHFSSPARVQLYSRRPSSPGHTGPLHIARPDSNHIHSELELSMSSISSGPGTGDNRSDYSEPIALAPRLYSKASQVDLLKRCESTSTTSTTCSEYLEPVSKNCRLDSKTSWPDCKRSRSDSTTSHNLHIVRKNQQEQQVPSDYVEPVSTRKQMLSVNELATHGSPRTHYTSSIHDYSEIPSTRNSAVSNDYVDNPVRLHSSD